MPNILARFVEDISNEEFLGNFYEKKTAIDESNRCYNYKSDKKKVVSFMLSGKVIIIRFKCGLKKRHCTNQNLKDDSVLLLTVWTF